MRRLALMVFVATAGCGDDTSSGNGKPGGAGGAAVIPAPVATPAPAQSTAPLWVVVSPAGILGSARVVAADSAFLYVAGADSSTVSGGSGAGAGGVPSSGGGIQWRIEKRHLSDGTLSPAFGNSGVVLSNTGMSNYVVGLAVDAAFLYVLGSAVVGPASGPNHYQWRIEKRFLSDGSLDPGFGGGGAVVTDPGGMGAFPGQIAIDSAFLYAVGNDYSAGTADIRWRMEKRRLSDGSLVPSFGAGGVITSNPGLGADGAFALAIDSASAVVAGNQTPPGSTVASWRIERRSLQDGSLQWASTSVLGSAMAVAVDSSHAYVTGSNTLGPLSSQAHLEKRRLSDGGLDASFGSSGSVTGPWGATPRSIAVDSGFLYAGGVDFSAGYGAWLWRVEKRSTRDGAPDPSFGTSGVVVSDPGPGSDQTLHCLAATPAALYLAGGPGLRLEMRSK